MPLTSFDIFKPQHFSSVILMNCHYGSKWDKLDSGKLALEEGKQIVYALYVIL